MSLASALSGRCATFMGGKPITRPITAKPVVMSCAARPMTVQVEAKRVCAMTGAKRNKANKVCFSNKKSRTFQQVNLQVGNLSCGRKRIACGVNAVHTVFASVCSSCSDGPPAARPPHHTQHGEFHVEEAIVLGEGAALGHNQTLSKGAAHHQEERSRCSGGRKWR